MARESWRSRQIFIDSNIRSSSQAVQDSSNSQDQLFESF